jgi:uncharacterized membrane protein YfcA
MHLTAAQLVLAMLGVATGALVQGAIGFGLNLVIAPVIALIAPEALPATALLVASPLAATMAARERGHIDRRGVLWVVLGRLPGTALGVAIVVAVSPARLSEAIGALVVIAVVLSVIAPPISVTRVTATLAGFLSATMATASAIGGPPVALLYQHHHGPVIRSTLATIFGIGTLMSLTALALAGHVGVDNIVLALELLPAAGVGLALARFLHPWLDARWVRPAVLTFAAVAGVAAIARGLL